MLGACPVSCQAGLLWAGGRDRQDPGRRMALLWEDAPGSTCGGHFLGTAGRRGPVPVDGGLGGVARCLWTVGWRRGLQEGEARAGTGTSEASPRMAPERPPGQSGLTLVDGSRGSVAARRLLPELATARAGGGEVRSPRPVLGTRRLGVPAPV